MNEENKAKMSAYKLISYMNDRHTVSLVKSTADGSNYVCRVADIRSYPVYSFLQHKHIEHTPAIIDLLPDGDDLIVIEEYINGQSLQDMLDDGMRFSVDEVINISITLCDVLIGLQKASPPVIHRDIKPSNIAKGDDGKYYLLDFDSSKYAYSNTEKDTILLGTPGYAAPEQFGFGSSGITTDIYAMGKLMTSLMTGDVEGQTPSGPLHDIIVKCTMLDTKMRYENAEDLRFALSSVKYGTHVSELTERPGRKYYAFLPPGFRSRNIFHMVTAVIVDFFVFDFILSMKFNSNDIPEIYYKICLFIMYFLIVAFDFNYMGSWRLVHKLSSMNIFLKFLVITVINVAIFLIVFILLTLIINSPIRQLIV